jgi:phospholipase C
MNSTRVVAVGVVIALGIGGCGQNTTPSQPMPIAQTPTSIRNAPSFRAMPNSLGSSKIQHVVIIVQENRTVNDLFNGFAGADTVRTAKNSVGKTVHLMPIRLTAPYDISHAHSAFQVEYANGQMNGFDLVGSSCRLGAHCPPKGMRAYGYVPQWEVQPYFTMARRYAFAKNMFQTNQGPSFPAHQYLVSGTSTISDGASLRASENPLTPQKKLTGGCDSPPGSLVELIDQYGNENQSMYPCFDRISLVKLIDANPQLTWHYYQNHLGAGLWNAFDAVKAVHDSPEFAKNVVAPPSQVLNDIDAGNLASVVWITPTPASSDHANITDGSGPSWVASVVNKIGLSKYWNNTAIFVTWDDWGGWYDPVVPPIYNSYELGLRIPLLVISAYARPHYISVPQHEFGGILKFTEGVFNLGSLGTTDVRADDLSDCFDFTKPPRKFVPIPAPHDARYFLRQGASTTEIDDDF